MSSWTYKVPTTCTPFTTYSTISKPKYRKYINRAKLTRTITEDELNKSNIRTLQYTAADVVLPDNFTWKTSGKIETPRDQGNCGCCWAFATTMALGDRFAIKYNIDPPKLSPTYLLTSTYSIQETTARTACDDGGYTFEAAKNLETQGVKTEKCWPYSIISNYRNNINSDTWKSCNPLPNNCCYNCCNSTVVGTECKLLFKAKTGSANNLAVIDKNVISGKNVYTINAAATIKAIQTDIMLNGPVIAAFQVYDDFMTYWDNDAPSGKVYIYKGSPTNNLSGGHAITITGWGKTIVNGKNIRYWELRNSWGTDTGDRGYGKVAFSIDEPANSILELDVPILQLDFYDPRWKKYRWSGGMVTLLPGSLPRGYNSRTNFIDVKDTINQYDYLRVYYKFIIISAALVIIILLLRIFSK